MARTANSRRYLLMFLTVLALLVNACGGGNGSDTTSPKPSSLDEEPGVITERPNQPSVGDCFNSPPGEDQGLLQVDEGATSGIEIVPCASDHDYEVYALSASGICNDAESVADLADHLGISEDSIDPDLRIRMFYDGRWENIACAIPSSDASS